MDTRLFINITKRDDDQQMVYGYASTPDLDSQGEVVTLSALKNALPEYLKFPTIREMHDAKAIGVTKQAELDGDKGLYIGAKIVDRDAWQKVKEGVYRAFSIGGRILKKEGDQIVEMILTEISLVDSPANKNAVITLYKSDESPMKKFEKHVSEFQKVQSGHTANTKGGVMSKQTDAVDEKEELKDTETQVVEEKAENEASEVTEVPEVEAEKTEVVEETETKESSDNPTMTKLEKMEKDLNKSEETEEEESDEEVEEPTTETEKMDKSDLMVKFAEQSKAMTKMVTKIEQLEAVTQKMSSILESVVGRVTQVESQPAAPKTAHSYAVDNATVAKGALTAKEKRIAEVQSKLDILLAMRNSDMAKYQSEGQFEAFALMDELSALQK